MIRLSVTVRSGQLLWDKRKLKAVMRSAGAEIAALTRSLLAGAGAGRSYRMSKARGGGIHRASAPGQPPARLSGALAGSVKVKPFRSGEGVSIRETQYYSLFLEAGAKGGAGSHIGGARGLRNVYRKRGGKNVLAATQGSRVLAPRPSLSRALEQRAASIGPRIAEAVDQELKFVREKVKRGPS